jgi:putative membrane protein
MNDELANDRTFLAWLRTGIACFGLGFVVAKFALIITAGGETISNEGLYSATGVVIVLCGAALVTVGYLQHRQVHRMLSTDAALPLNRWPLTTTVIAVAAALVLGVLIVIST